MTETRKVLLLGGEADGMVITVSGTAPIRIPVLGPATWGPGDSRPVPDVKATTYTLRQWGFGAIRKAVWVGIPTGMDEEQAAVLMEMHLHSLFTKDLDR